MLPRPKSWGSSRLPCSPCSDAPAGCHEITIDCSTAVAQQQRRRGTVHSSKCGQCHVDSRGTRLNTQTCVDSCNLVPWIQSSLPLCCRLFPLLGRTCPMHINYSRDSRLTGSRVCVCVGVCSLTTCRWQTKSATFACSPTSHPASFHALSASFRGKR